MGRSSKLARPMEVYDHPVNMFVAGFIGSPAMNFFQGKLTAQNSDLFVDLGKFAVKLPKSQINRFGNHVNQRVVFGIRPENISDREEAENTSKNACRPRSMWWNLWDRR